MIRTATGSYDPKQFTLTHPELRRSVLAWKSTLSGHHISWRIIAALGISLTAYYAGKKEFLILGFTDNNVLLMFGIGTFFLFSAIKFLMEMRNVRYVQHLREILKDKKKISHELSKEITHVDALSHRCVGGLSNESLWLILARADKNIEKAGININEERISLRAHAKALENLYTETVPWALSEYGILNTTGSCLDSLDIRILTVSLAALQTVLSRAADIDLAAAESNRPVIVEISDCWNALTECHNNFTHKLWSALSRTQSNMCELVVSIRTHMDFFSS